MQSLGYAGTAAGVHDEDDDTGRRMLQWQAVLLTTLRRTDADAADAATAAMAMRIWERWRWWQIRYCWRKLRTLLRKVKTDHSVNSKEDGYGGNWNRTDYRQLRHSAAFVVVRHCR
jgi:hypothetical protein